MESGKGMTGTWLSNQPCLLSENPRSIDLVRIDKSNLSITDQLPTDAAGMVLDLDGMPPLHDGEVLALMTGLRTHLGSEKPLILAGRIDRVSNRMRRDQPLDGVLVRWLPAWAWQPRGPTPYWIVSERCRRFRATAP